MDFFFMLYMYRKFYLTCQISHIQLCPWQHIHVIRSTNLTVCNRCMYQLYDNLFICVIYMPRIITQQEHSQTSQLCGNLHTGVLSVFISDLSSQTSYKLFVGSVAMCWDNNISIGGCEHYLFLYCVVGRTGGSNNFKE